MDAPLNFKELLQFRITADSTLLVQSFSPFDTNTEARVTEPFRDILVGGLLRRDETSDLTPCEVISALRCVRHDRTGLIISEHFRSGC